MTIEDIIKKAGELLVEEFGKSPDTSDKAQYDLVTDTDKKIDAFLINEISKLFPNDGIFSEESGTLNKKSDRRWILDPIDGTADFVFGVPYCAISVALVSENGIEVAYVYNPIAGEMYHSSKDYNKSCLNGKEIHVSDTAAVAESLISFGFSANPGSMTLYLQEWSGLMKNCKKALPLIAPALTICNVARGRTDASIDIGSSMEGKAAAGFILQNAGGSITGYRTSRYDFRETGHICSNGIINVEEYRWT